MREAVICEPVRTPVGRYGGALRDVPPAELAAPGLRELVERTGLTSADIDDVLLGQCYPNSDAPAIGRVAALDAGLDVSVTGMQLDRRCGSGLQAVLNAAMQVQTEVSDLVVAGGAESMSSAAFYSTSMRWCVTGEGVMLRDGLARGRVTAGGYFHPVPGGMLETAENLRLEYDIPRLEHDELALRSHHRAVAAQRSGAFAEEIVPVEVRTRKGTTRVDSDEHPRPDASLDALGSLRPVLGGSDPDATVTAANASGQNDGAAVCVVTHTDAAERLGLRPLARLASSAAARGPPRTLRTCPVPATAPALERAGLKLSDIDLIELNEAFATQVLACTREWGFAEADWERTNVNGSGISLRHPVRATGCPILTTLPRELDRRGGRDRPETLALRARPRPPPPFPPPP